MALLQPTPSHLVIKNNIITNNLWKHNNLSQIPIRQAY